MKTLWKLIAIIVVLVAVGLGIWWYKSPKVEKDTMSDSKIENVKSIIHYHQALTPETYTHRNGRTARVDREGDIYILIGPDEDIKEFTEFDDTDYPEYSSDREESGGVSGDISYDTIRFSAGKKEKLSKGDILGFLIKECGASGDDIGRIDVYDHYALAAVRSSVTARVLKATEGKKIKGVKRLVSKV